MRPTSEQVRALLGRKVRVTLNRGDGEPATVITGTLLGFGDGGDFEILEADGFVHYCWAAAGHRGATTRKWLTYRNIIGDPHC